MESGHKKRNLEEIGEERVNFLFQIDDNCQGCAGTRHGCGIMKPKGARAGDVDKITQIW